MRDTKLFDRVYGCMMGGAVGDAMGFATEGFSYKTIRERYGRITGPKVRQRPGEVLHPPVVGCCYTDDTVMKHMVSRAIFDCEGHPTIEALAKSWRETIRDPTEWTWWNNTRVVWAKLTYEPWIPLQDVGRDGIPANDAAMIIAPVGILNLGDPDQAAADTWRIMPMIQHGYSIECAAAMAASYAVALSPGATMERVIETAKQFSPALRPHLDKALDLASKCASMDEFTERYYASGFEFPNEVFWNSISGDPGWSFGADPLETCTEALTFMYLAKGNAKEAILGAANFGRDCDTSSGMAAAFCCALNGTATLPKEWIEVIQRDNPAPDIAEYAERLCGLIMKESEKRAAQVEELRKLL